MPKPWSEEQIEAVFGFVSPDERAAIDVALTDIDHELRSLVAELDSGWRYTRDGFRKERVWSGIEAEIDSPRSIDNEDGSVSRGAMGAGLTIERLPGELPRWLVWATVTQHCNRLQCPDDPHEFLSEEADVDSPVRAADIAGSMASRLVACVRSHADDQPGWFVH